MPRSSKWSLHSEFPTKTLHALLLSPISATYPGHHILFDFIAQIILAEEYVSWNSSLDSLLHCPVTSSLLGPTSFLSTPFSNTLPWFLHSYVTDQVSYPHKTTDKIIVLCTSIFIFWTDNWKTGRTASAPNGSRYTPHSISYWLFREHNFDLLGLFTNIHFRSQAQ